MSQYREYEKPHEVSVEELYILEDLLNTQKLTEKQKSALRSLLKEHYTHAD